MSSKPVFSEPQVGRWIVFAALIAAGVALIAFGWRHRGDGQTGNVASPAPAGATNQLVITNTLTPSTNPPAPASSPIRPEQTAQYSWFQLRPLEVARENAHFQWTAEDGKDPNVIQKLAHNDLEFERMVAENNRIFRRQLVYHRDTAAAQVERAKSTAEPLREMQLPGLDGQEIQFQIKSSDLNPSGQQGSFSGQIAGQLDSMVTFAFKGGREAFTVLSPADNLYLIGEPREPGELIVKSIDITNYSGTGGDPRIIEPSPPGISNEHQK